ncbi:MAG: hypothetical protein QM758_27560 [Armatimonas sp.]
MQEAHRRLRIALDDSAQALREIEELRLRGEFVRGRMPAVMDFDAGLSIAHLPSPVPTLTPSSAGVVRPDLASSMGSAVADLKWPPKPGQYDERGNITATGELTALASALTYEELRAFLLGLVQSKSPTAAQKVQIFLAANALTTVLYGLNLSAEQYAQAWKAFFTGAASGGAGGTKDDPAVDPHDLVTSPPVATIIDPGIISVVPFGLPELPPYPYAHQNTDRASKWRATVGSGVTGGRGAFQVTFGTTFHIKQGGRILISHNASEGYGYGGTPGGWAQLYGNRSPSDWGLDPDRGVVAFDGSRAFAVPGSQLVEIFGASWRQTVYA